jgi:autotransporter passenger strand-loop-strand repeat protein
VASGVQVQDGELQIDSGGVASATVLTSSLAGNNEQVYGRAVGTLVQSGAADEVQSGGQSVNATWAPWLKS